MVLDYGLCGRCDLIDVVRDHERPLCRWCDPTLAAFLTERIVARRELGRQEATVVEFRGLPQDPSGKEWAA